MVFAEAKLQHVESLGQPHPPCFVKSCCRQSGSEQYQWIPGSEQKLVVPVKVSKTDR